MRQKWKPLWKTNWKCPRKVDVLLQTHVNAVNCLFFILTWDMSWEQPKTMVTSVSIRLCFCPVLKVYSSHLLEKCVSPQLACVPSWMRQRANTLQSWCDFFHPCMCFSPDSTVALKSSQLIAGAEKPLPSFWHIYSSPTFASLEPSFPCSQNPVHKRLLFHSNFLLTSGPVFLPCCTGSPEMAVYLRWSGLNTSLKHSKYWVFPQEDNLVPVRKANTPSHYINQKGDQRYELLPWANLHQSYSHRPREGGLTSTQTFLSPQELSPFPNLQPRAGLNITYVYKRTCPSRYQQSPNRALGEVPICQ